MISKLVLLDYVLILAVLGSAVLGVQRGFSRTAAGTVALLAALISAILCAGTLSPYLTICLKGTVDTALKDQLAAYMTVGSSGDELVSAVMAALQGTVVKTMLFTLTFLVVLLIWLYICNYFNVAAKFPAAKKFNQLGGALFGILKGIIWIFIVLYILNQMGILSNSLLSSSFLLQKVQSVFPISL